MMRSALLLVSIAALGLGAGVFARSRSADATLNRVQGVRIRSRIPCDGSTNPQEPLKFRTSFSPGGSERAFHLDVFESRYCRAVDLYFFCVFHGRDRWKHEWVGANNGAPATSRYWMDSCSAWRSKDVPDYILSGWYRTGGQKTPWTQATIKQISADPEVYEFTDPSGGAARVEIRRE